MNYGVRDESGKFAKKEVRGDNATQDEAITDTAETTEEQEHGGVTVLYCDSIEGVGAVVDKALVSLGIISVGTEVDKALAFLGLVNAGTTLKETTPEPTNP